MLDDLADRYQILITVEENTIEGGFGSGVARYLSDQMREGQRVHTLGIPDRFFSTRFHRARYATKRVSHPKQ